VSLCQSWNSHGVVSGFNKLGTAVIGDTIFCCDTVGGVLGAGVVNVEGNGCGLQDKDQRSGFRALCSDCNRLLWLACRPGRVEVEIGERDRREKRVNMNSACIIPSVVHF